MATLQQLRYLIAVAEYGYLIAKYTPLTGTFQKLNARFMKTRLVDIL